VDVSIGSVSAQGGVALDAANFAAGQFEIHARDLDDLSPLALQKLSGGIDADVTLTHADARQYAAMKIRQAAIAAHASSATAHSNTNRVAFARLPPSHVVEDRRPAAAPKVLLTVFSDQLAQNMPVASLHAPSILTRLLLSNENYAFATIARSGATETATASSALSGVSDKTQVGAPNQSAPKFPTIYFIANSAEVLSSSNPLLLPGGPSDQTIACWNVG
jgi:hypothetical protein